MTDEVFPVTDLVRRFAQEYVIDFKVGPAAERAGISRGHAQNCLLDPRVQAIINEHKRRTTERVNVSIDSVLADLNIYRTVTVADFFEMVYPMPGVDKWQAYERLKPVDRWTDDMRKAVKKFKHGKYGPELELYGAMDANALIGKFFGMFKDGLEVGGPGGKPVEMIHNGMTPQQAAEAYAGMIGK